MGVEGHEMAGCQVGYGASDVVCWARKLHKRHTDEFV